MFMRYRGGGIGHVTVQLEMQADEGVAMMDVDVQVDPAEDKTVDEKVFTNRLEDVCQAARTVGMGTREEREEVEDPQDSDSDDSNNSDDELTDGEDDSDDNMGPEDGEDMGFLDTGYGAL